MDEQEFSLEDILKEFGEHPDEEAAGENTANEAPDEEAAEEIANGDEISVNFNTGEIYNITQNKKYMAQPFPPFIQNITVNLFRQEPENMKYYLHFSLYYGSIHLDMQMR